MRRIILLLCCTLAAITTHAQSMTVTGQVVDQQTGESLIGATVLEVGTTNGVITDLDGHFTIALKDKKNRLEVSYVGYVTQKLAASSQMIIKLKTDALALDEVVVVGYGVMRKSDLTGAVSKVKADELGKVASVDASQALQGKVAGVNIQMNSGEPGAGTKVRIRGVGTINSSSPLYVVDGFPVGDISHIAPNDIESIEVLKDASATAIYGSRGANGVILVKTRSGARGQKTKVNFNAYVSMSQIVDKIDMCNASQYAVLKREAMDNAGVSMSSQWDNILTYVTDNNLKGTDWQDEIFRDAVTQNYNLSVAGGGENNKYDLGVTYAQEEGVVKETYMDKLMAHLNNEYKFNDHVKLGLNVFYTNYERTGNNSDYYAGPLAGALRADPVSAPWDDYTSDFGEIYFAFGLNPARAVDENKYKEESENRFLLNSYLQLDDLLDVKGLSFRAQFGQKLVFSKIRNYYPEYYVTADQNRQQSSLYVKRADTKEWSTSDYFNYNRLFGKHSVNAMAGFEAQKFESTYTDLTVYDVPKDADLRYVSASSNSTQFTAGGLKSHSSLLSYFTRANYSYDNKYLFTATMRADGSSKFVDHWGYFPSFSAGWNIYQESFMKDTQDWLSQLKLRAGWGQVGNQNAAGNHDYVALMTNGYTYVFNGQPVDGSIQQRIANKELSWETSEQYNVGVDAGFWANKLTATVDLFVRKTNDMILSTPIPMYAGFWKPNTNAGSVKNSGVELSLNHSNEIGDFTYNIGFNISCIKNEVTSIGGGDPIEGGNVSLVGNTTITRVGDEIGVFYGLKTDGIFNTQEELDAWVGEDGSPIQPNAGLGDVKFIDANHDGKIDEQDRQNLGSAIPTCTYGINASCAYKGFDFNVALQGSCGNEIVNGMYYTLNSSDMSEWNVSTAMLNRWTPDNPTSNTPRVISSNPNKNGRFSDRFVEDGSYLRIRNMQLGYTIPKELSTRACMQRLRLYLSCDNLYTWTKYSGYDPEVAGSNDLGAGVDIANYPIPRTFTVGVNVTF